MGSIHSLYPKICEVDAVGIGANNNELRIPRSRIRVFKSVQSYRSLGSTPHKSNCNSPREAGDPLKLE